MTLTLLITLLSFQPPPSAILGTVTEFRAHALEIGVQPDTGSAVLVKISAETEFVKIPPGELGLAKATPASVTDIALGDRLLVSFVTGMAEARRIVVVSAGDIAKRNEAERLDWQKRGISGVVVSKNGSEVTLQTRTILGPVTNIVLVTRETTIRRYAADSVKFTDAEKSSVAEIGIGDQFRARGDKSVDGTAVVAQDVVFGTFLTKVGLITSVDREARVLKIEDLATKKPLTIRLTADSQIKMMPEARTVLARDQHAGPPELTRMLQRLPAATMTDLKVGGGLIVTSTRGSKSDEVTAIMVLANADALIQIAQQQAAAQPGKSPLDVIAGLHGGLLGGSSGLSLPAMLP